MHHSYSNPQEFSKTQNKFHRLDSRSSSQYQKDNLASLTKEELIIKLMIAQNQIQQKFISEGPKAEKEKTQEGGAILFLALHQAFQMEISSKKEGKSIEEVPLAKTHTIPEFQKIQKGLKKLKQTKAVKRVSLFFEEIAQIL